MIKLRKKLLISTLLLSIIAISGTIFHPVYARCEPTDSTPWLEVSPPNRIIALNPGDKYSGEFTVTNIGSEAFSFRVYASPFSVSGETYDHDYVASTDYNQIYRWITFDQAQFDDLQVCSKQIVKYRINVPTDAPSGSQHAILFAESSTNAPSNDKGIDAIPRIGMRLRARIVGKTRTDVKITEYSFSTLYITFDNAQISATSKVKNAGNTDMEAKYHFQIDPFFGGDSVFLEDRTVWIYPETEYRHNAIWDNTPRLGFFNVTYSVAIGNEIRDEQRIVLVIPSWLLAIILLLLTFLIIWIILKVKKRRRLRSRMKL